MEWLIIIVLMLLVISPMLWLRPSSSQRRLGKLRDEAIKAGAKVKLGKPPLHEASSSMPCYRWLYPPQRPGPHFLLVRNAEASESLKEFRPGWRWRVEPLRPLPDAVDARLGELLTRLPEDALVIESDRDALTLWWWESQGGERFTGYLDDFSFLCQQLAGRPDRPAPRQVGFGGRQ
ncbi:preprotein translocase subunit YajC [Litchfieldella rifensis]|uniref:Preprotein translocase subunit YajC n=1 Tax=Litchfieldella rifensis TaxID=762643 RepID=A0ABV7LJX5_9GAMM